MIRRGVAWDKAAARARRLPAAVVESVHGKAHGQDSPAAVLVPIVRDGDRALILLTRRADHLRHHPGQVSFPGGRMHAGDADLLATALRETEEELGFGATRIEVVGRLDECLTGTGFAITPFVALIAELPPLVPDPGEVGAVFTLPLDPPCIFREMRREAMTTPRGRRDFWVMDHGEHRIWGATARMLRELVERLV